MHAVFSRDKQGRTWDSRCLFAARWVGLSCRVFGAERDGLLTPHRCAWYGSPQYVRNFCRSVSVARVQLPIYFPSRKAV